MNNKELIKRILYIQNNIHNILMDMDNDSSSSSSMEHTVLSKEDIKDRFIKCLQWYMDTLDVDLSYMKIKISTMPEHEDGTPAPEDITELAGSRTSKGYIQITPEPFRASPHYGKQDMDPLEFITQVMIHELAHEVYENNKDDYDKVGKYIDKAMKEHFSTYYLDHENFKGEEKKVETYAEYMSNVVFTGFITDEDEDDSE